MVCFGCFDCLGVFLSGLVGGFGCFMGVDLVTFELGLLVLGECIWFWVLGAGVLWVLGGWLWTLCMLVYALRLGLFGFWFLGLGSCLFLDFVGCLRAVWVVCLICEVFDLWFGGNDCFGFCFLVCFFGCWWIWVVLLGWLVG